MATKYPTNKKRTNYARLCVAIIDLSADVLRDMLHRQVSPTDIGKELWKSPDLSKVIRKEQWQYIMNAPTIGSYEEFDVTLLSLVIRILSVQELNNSLKASIPCQDLQSAIKLCPSLSSDPKWMLSPAELKDVQAVGIKNSYHHFKDELLWKLCNNLCGINLNLVHPSVPWGSDKMPDKNHITIGDDVERLRHLRNKAYGHVPTTEIPDKEFKSCWKELEDIMLRMDIALPGRNYRKELDRIKTNCMDVVSEQTFCDKIKKMAEGEKEVQVEVQKLKDDVAGIKEDMQLVKGIISGKKQSGEEKDENLHVVVVGKRKSRGYNNNNDQIICSAEDENGVCLKAPDEECEGGHFIKRKGWNAMEPKKTEHMHTPVSIVFIHHTGQGCCDTREECVKHVKEVQNYHVHGRGWDDVGYNFLVGEDGNIYEARGWDRIGAHTIGYNAKSIAIAAMGDFNHRAPNKKLLDAIHRVIARGVLMKKIIADYKLYGHRDASSQFDSPGHYLYSIIRRWDHYDKHGPSKE